MGGELCSLLNFLSSQLHYKLVKKKKKNYSVAKKNTLRRNTNTNHIAISKGTEQDTGDNKQ